MKATLPRPIHLRLVLTPRPPMARGFFMAHTGRHFGIVPQPFTHLAAVHAVMHLIAHAGALASERDRQQMAV